MSVKAANAQQKKSRKTQAERTALSDQRMFEAAISLINERGTQKTTLKEIGELAGYSRGLANYRFGSKDGLMQELFVRFDERWKEHLSSYVKDLTGISGILAAADALRDFLQLESAARLYDRSMQLWWQYGEVSPLAVHTVRYEQLVNSLEDVLSPALAFLGLDWDDGIGNYTETAHRRGNIETPSYHQVTEEIYTHARWRWQRYREQLAPVLPVLLPWAVRLGYDA